MGIGFSIFLLAVGAILKFAVHATVAGIDIRVIGVILMAAGVLGLILTMVVLAPRRRRSMTETSRVSSGGSTANSGNVTPRTETTREVTETSGEVGDNLT
jgi:hypothetical protein